MRGSSWAPHSHPHSDGQILFRHKWESGVEQWEEGRTRLRSSQGTGQRILSVWWGPQVRGCLGTQQDLEPRERGKGVRLSLVSAPTS